MAGWQDFSGINRGYVLELFERYSRDPGSVDEATRRYLERWSPPSDEFAQPTRVADERRAERTDAIVGAVALAESIRRYGHLAARIDPLGATPPSDPLLLERTHNVTDEDLRRLPPSIIGGPVASEAANASEAIAALRRVYLLDDRLRLCAHLRARGARVAAGGGRARAVSARRPIRSIHGRCSIG